jgi:hypothetical protein
MGRIRIILLLGLAPLICFVLLVCCWLLGPIQTWTKIVLTLIYCASWLLVLSSWGYLMAGQAVVAIILGFATFGARFGRL